MPDPSLAEPVAHRSFMSTKAIFFDIDDTLFSTSVFAERAREDAVDAMIALGVRCGREDMLRELNEVIAEFSSNYEHHFDKLLTRLPLEATIGLNHSLVVAAGVTSYHDTKFRELSSYDDVYEVMSILAETDLRLGIISAGLVTKQMEKILRLRVYRYVDPRAIFITEQVGIGKPNPKLFHRAAERIGLKPEECVYVGDHPIKDVDAANEAGMITVWNRREGKHLTTRGQTEPDHVIFNFWDLLELLRGPLGLEIEAREA